MFSKQLSPRASVLVVDDDPSVRRLLERALRNGGFQPRPAMDIASAKALLEEGAAAVLLDMLFVNSAGLSGLDLLRYIRADPRYKDLPVVLLTGFTLNQAVLQEVKSLGAKLCQKPVSPTVLVDRLKELVSLTPCA